MLPSGKSDVELFVSGIPGKSNVITTIACLGVWLFMGLFLIPFYGFLAKKNLTDLGWNLLAFKFIPYGLTLVFLGYYIVNLSMYIDTASSGRLPSSYYTLSYILMGVMSVQFALFFRTRKESASNMKNTSLYAMILGLFTFVTVVSLDIVLKFFTTDGFKSKKQKNQK